MNSGAQTGRLAAEGLMRLIKVIALSRYEDFAADVKARLVGSGD